MFLFRSRTRSENRILLWTVLLISLASSLVTLVAFLPVVAQASEIAQSSKQVIKRADKLARKGELAEAEKLLRDYLERSPADSAVKLRLGYVFLKQRRLIDAYDHSFPIAQAEPRNGYAFSLLGSVLLNAGNFREARPILYQALNLDEDIGLAWAGLGLLDFYENKIQDSLNKLQIAHEKEPENPDYLFALAQVYARAERYKEAADTYRRFLMFAHSADSDRRDRIKGLIRFLAYLGNQQELYRSSITTKQTVVPFSLVRDRPVIDVYVNGRKEKLRFVLDTGSGISVISNETAEKLKIGSIARGGMARAVGGSGKFEIVYGFLRSVDIGEARIKNVPVYIRKFHDDAERIDGYIGLSLISKFLTTVDYGGKNFSLTKKEAASLLQYDNGSIALPLRLTSSGFLSGEVHLADMEQPVNFIVDTGASISVISNELANTVEMNKFSTDEKMRVIGAAGITENVRSFLIPKVKFGTHTREAIRAISLDLDLINEASGFQQAGILGGNFLKNYRLTFDFQNSKVTFIPVKE